MESNESIQPYYEKQNVKTYQETKPKYFDVYGGGGMKGKIGKMKPDDLVKMVDDRLHGQKAGF